MGNTRSSVLDVSCTCLLYTKWSYKVSSKMCESRMEGSGLDSHVNVGITSI